MTETNSSATPNPTSVASPAHSPQPQALPDENGEDEDDAMEEDEPAKVNCDLVAVSLRAEDCPVHCAADEFMLNCDRPN
jgi:hypothetical protein